MVRNTLVACDISVGNAHAAEIARKFSRYRCPYWSWLFRSQMAEVYQFKVISPLHKAIVTSTRQVHVLGFVSGYVAKSQI